jgi:hypothetical protein
LKHGTHEKHDSVPTGTKEKTTLIKHLEHFLALLGACISPTLDTFGCRIRGGKVIFPVIFKIIIDDGASIGFDIDGR